MCSGVGGSVSQVKIPESQLIHLVGQSLRENDREGKPPLGSTLFHLMERSRVLGTQKPFQSNWELTGKAVMAYVQWRLRALTRMREVISLSLRWHFWAPEVQTPSRSLPPKGHQGPGLTARRSYVSENWRPGSEQCTCLLSFRVSFLGIKMGTPNHQGRWQRSRTSGPQIHLILAQ